MFALLWMNALARDYRTYSIRPKEPTKPDNLLPLTSSKPPRDCGEGKYLSGEQCLVCPKECDFCYLDEKKKAPSCLHLIFRHDFRDGLASTDNHTNYTLIKVALFCSIGSLVTFLVKRSCMNSLEQDFGFPGKESDAGFKEKKS